MVKESKRVLATKYQVHPDLATIECIPTDVCEPGHLVRITFPEGKKYKYVDWRDEPTKDGGKYSLGIGPNREKIEEFVKRWPILGR
jgi:hypothetical protein